MTYSAINRSLFGLLFLLVTASGFCQEPWEHSDYSESDSCSKISSAQPLNYVRLGAGKVTPNSHSDIGPSIHLGRRYELDDSAIDISINWAHSEGANGYRKHDFVSFPKILYLYYHEPQCDNSWFYGPGLSWAWLKRDRHDKEFTGICLEGAVGYEFKRYSDIRTIIQLDVSQPLLAADKKGGIPGPVITCSAGVGF